VARGNRDGGGEGVRYARVCCEGGIDEGRSVRKNR